MKHQQLIFSISQRAALTQAVVKDVLSALCEQATENFQSGENVYFPGVGKLVVVKRRAITGRNMRTGEQIPVPERRTVKFLMSKRTKAMLL